MELILNIDIAIFHFINRGLSNPLFDFIMPLFHHEKYFIPLLIIPWVSAIVYDRPNRWKLVCIIPITILFVDQTGLLIKNYIFRPRPWEILDSTIIHHLVNPSGTNLSYPSNHAANSAALATLFSLIYRNTKYIFWSIAVIVMFSRIYIGVHFPLDVASGCVIGIFYGLLFVKVWEYSNKQYSN
tara:strand:+ start:2527 stop:3078 length:552 start_codon:yes stop_codon:yes gene_type:complete